MELTLHQLVHQTGRYHYVIADMMCMRADVFSRMLRSAPRSEAVTKRLVAVLCGQLGVCDRSTLMKSIDYTRERNEEKRQRLWQDLMDQVKKDEEAQARKTKSSGTGKSEGKGRSRLRKK